MEREWLKANREKAGLTQKAIAEKLGISEGYYCFIEQGKRQRPMDIFLCAKIADIFSLPIQQIVDIEIAEGRRHEQTV